MTRVRFVSVVMGLRLNSGREMVYLPDEEADLSFHEFAQLPRATFVVIPAHGEPMNLDGEVFRCEEGLKCGGLWRRPRGNNRKSCSECMGEIEENSRESIHRHLRIG